MEWVTGWMGDTPLTVMTTRATAFMIMVMFDVVSILIFSIQVYFRDEHKLAIMAALFI